MREIVQEGAPVLRETALSVPKEMFGSKELENLVSDMAEALDAEPEGVALAAPQVGVSLRLFIVRKDRTLPPHEPTANGEPVPRTAEVDVYINPEITKSSRKRTRADEGCLSVRGLYGTTTPHEQVTVRAQNVDGSYFTRGAGGLLAQIFEHEVNHLNGILFIDHAEHVIELRKQPSDA